MTTSNKRQRLMAAALALSAGTLTTPAIADSCWLHNGSLMRLQAEGVKRWFVYEKPRAELRRAGVDPGWLLFAGVKNGTRYEGVAHVFSRHCPDQPLAYSVSGPVRSDQLQVMLQGTRPVNDKCQPTGERITDTLVFTYSHTC